MHRFPLRSNLYMFTNKCYYPKISYFIPPFPADQARVRSATCAAVVACSHQPSRGGVGTAALTYASAGLLRRPLLLQLECQHWYRPEVKLNYYCKPALYVHIQHACPCIWVLLRISATVTWWYGVLGPSCDRHGCKFATTFKKYLYFCLQLLNVITLLKDTKRNCA